MILVNFILMKSGISSHYPGRNRMFLLECEIWWFEYVILSCD